MLGQSFDIIAGIFFAGECIELTANFIDGFGYFLCGAFFGAFEHHMLDKMGNTPLGFRLIAGANAHPDAHRKKLYMIDCFGNHTNTVVQCSNFIIQTLHSCTSHLISLYGIIVSFV